MSGVASILAMNSMERRDFLHGGAEFFKFVVRVAAMDGFGFVAGKFHPQFRGDAFVRQRKGQRRLLPTLERVVPLRLRPRAQASS